MNTLFKQGELIYSDDNTFTGGFVLYGGAVTLSQPHALGRGLFTIGDPANALDKLTRVRLVQFRFTEDCRAAHPGVEDREYLNVVAQEFQTVFPEDVKRSGEKLASRTRALVRTSCRADRSSPREGPPRQ